MCGIVGIIGPQEREWVSLMNAVQTHRGPDDGGEFFDPATLVSLAMRRLSIVDLADGHQPMIDEGRGRVVVFNGEIFNAPSLRQGLEADGYHFNTRNSDTECLLYLYDLHGVDMVNHLNGMFAFVIYDRKTNTLFAARDHAGIKPLYWGQKEGRFYFASELKSLLKLPFVERKINPQSLHHYLTLQFIPPSSSIVSDISKLPAGHLLMYDIACGSVEVRRYWRPPVPARITAASTSCQAAGAIRELLKVAVKDWLMSDVPVGCSLSGGLDSTTVVGLMAELGFPRIRTWTLGFDEAVGSSLDERDLASAVARRFNTEHHEIIVRADSLVDELESMVWHLDEPYAGGLPSWFVFREMSRQVKVAMTGTGGDELFGNYGKWRMFPPLAPRQVAMAMRRIRSGGVGDFLRYPHGALYHGYYFEKEKKQILSSDLHTENLLSTSSYLEKMWQEAGDSDARNVVPYIDFQLQLPEEFLHMTDRFSMAWSLEARTPFLDRRLVDYVLSLPPFIRTSPTNLKVLLKQAVADLIPEELLTARKRGFVLPINEWLRGKLREMVEALLGEDFLRQQGLFNPGIYRAYVRPHLDGQRDLSWQIWTLLMFQLWHVGTNQR